MTDLIKEWLQTLFTASFAQKGFDDLTGVAPAGAVYNALQVLEDSTVTCDVVNGPSFAAKALTAGTIIYGTFINVTVNSGNILGYKK